MSLKGNFNGAILLVFLVGVFMVVADEVDAAERLTLAERRVQREEEREARRLDFDLRRQEREDKREARRQELAARRQARELDRLAEEEVDTECECRARLSLTKPELQWRGNSLVFVPRVDVLVRTKGELNKPNWSVNLKYSGEALGNSFSGEKNVVAGSCVDSRYDYSGVALPEVSIKTALRSMFGEDDDLDGLLKMKVGLNGCGDDEEVFKQASFSIEDWGNLRVGGWRTVR